MKRGVFGLAMVFVAGPLPGAAQVVTAQVVTAQVVADCSNIINEHVRLACFDRAVSDMRERSSPAPQYPPPYSGGQPGQAPQSYRTYPPLMPRTPPMAARVAAPEVPAGVVRSRVISHDRAFRKYVLVLENGQVWKQTGGGGRLPFPEDGPTYALVRETAHDGFLLSLEGSRKSIPVKRLK